MDLPSPATNDAPLTGPPSEDRSVARDPIPHHQQPTAEQAPDLPEVAEQEVTEQEVTRQEQETAGQEPTQQEPTQPNSAASPTVLLRQPRLVAQAMMEAAEPIDLQTGSLALYSRRASYKETANEDAAAIIPIAGRGVVLAVADGIGGLPQGEEAARVTLDTLIEFVDQAESPERLRSAILDAIETANRRVLALGGGAGTTLAVAQIIDQRVRTYHVGDSEIFVVGGRGMLKLETISHGPVAYGVHSGLIDPIDALSHENRNLVSNVVGARDMRIELGPSVKLAQRDLVLICSDGITDNLHSEELSQLIRGKSPQEAAACLLQALQSRREPNFELDFKEDDATFVIYRRAAREKSVRPG